MIVKQTPGREGLHAWKNICTDTRNVLRQYRDELVGIFQRGERGEKLDLTASEIFTSLRRPFLPG